MAVRSTPTQRGTRLQLCPEQHRWRCVGADYRFSPYTLAGFAVSGGGTSFSVANSGTGRSDLPGRRLCPSHRRPAYISAALAYGWQDVTTDRTVTIAGSDLLAREFHANTFSGRAEGGYRFVAPWSAASASRLTPQVIHHLRSAGPMPSRPSPAPICSRSLTLQKRDRYAQRARCPHRQIYPMQMASSPCAPGCVAHDFNPDRNIAARSDAARRLIRRQTCGAGQRRRTGHRLAEMKWLNGLSLAADLRG